MAGERLKMLGPVLAGLLNAGKMHHQAGRLSEAAQCYRDVLARAPGHAETMQLLGAVAYAKGDLDAASALLEQAVSAEPGSGRMRANLGLVRLAQGAALAHRGDLQSAVALLQQAVELAPASVHGLNSLAKALAALGRTAEALARLEQSHALDPQEPATHVTKGLALLASGSFEEGWREYTWRVAAYVPGNEPGRSLPRALAPLDLHEKHLLVVHDQGIGDELFFLRFASAARARGARVSYLGSPRVAAILQGTAEVDALVGAMDDAAGADAVVRVGDLPLVIGVRDSDALPAPLPLRPTPEATLRSAERLAPCGAAPLLGVAWRAGTPRGAGALVSLSKEVPLDALARAVAAWPGEVVIVQREPQAGEIAAFNAALGRKAHDLSALNADLHDMLALLARLDDYVGVSSTNMHLRAGCRKPARVLVPMPAEWRWMAAGDTSPWFPEFRLYRQAPDGAWSTALDRLARDLRAGLNLGSS